MKKVLFIAAVIIIAVAVVYRLMLAYYGITVTSWFRTPWRNADVGGLSGSLHQIGWGFDVVPVNGPMRELLASLPFGKVVVEADHIHLQVI